MRAGLPLGDGVASEGLRDGLCAIDCKGRSAGKGAAATVFTYLALRRRLSASMGSCSRNSRAVCSLARPARWLLARCAADEVDGSVGLDSALSSLVSTILCRSRRLDFAPLLGAAFAFFLLVPSTLRVSVEINQIFGFAIRWTPGSYYSLVTWLTLGVGVSFEFPLVIVLLVWLGVMTTDFLRKYRRHAVIVIFIIAAIVTPTPDPITQTMFAIPLYLLYEIAIIASSRVEKRKEKLRLLG